MIDRLTALTAFVRTADLGNFARAAESLAVPPSTVARHVGTLEKMLGHRLFVRNTHTCALTREGERFLPAARNVLAASEALFDTPLAPQASLVGTLRVGCGVAVSHTLLPDWLAGFTERHIGVAFDVTTADRPFNLTGDRLDLALQAVDPVDENAVVHAVVPIESCMAASPEYLERCGTPRDPADLPQHRTLVNELFGNVWTMHRENEPLTRIEVPSAFRTNNTLLLREMAMRGFGIAFFAVSHIEKDLAAGRLVRVLPAWRGDTVHLKLLLPARSYVSHLARAFADFLLAEARNRSEPLPASY